MNNHVFQELSAKSKLFSAYEDSFYNVLVI